MRDSQRTSSARSNGGSRRRRWEVKSKEAFETSLAVEYDSPQRKTSPYKKETKKEPSHNEYESRNPFNTSGQDHHEAPPKAPPGNTSNATDTDSDPDLLAAKLSALIEEANIKTKDTQRSYRERVKSEPQYTQEQTVKDGCDVKFAQDIPSETLYKDQSDIKGHKDKDKAQFLNDKFETKSLKMAVSPQMKTGGSDHADFRASAPPLSTEHEEATPGKKKHKKSEQRLVVADNTGKESYISLQLKELEEDIMVAHTSGELCKLSAPGLLLTTSVSKPPTHISTVFKEEVGGFVVAKHGFEGIQKRNEDLYDVNQIPTRSSHAIFLQGGFRTFSVLCQGLLAGIALAHCLVIFLLDGDPSAISGLYTPVMAHVFFALIMFLTTLCLVAACDRHDLLGLGVFTCHGIRIPWTPAFYISSLVLSLVVVRAENVLINLDRYQDQVFTQKEVASYVEWWRWLCVARSSLAVLAWLAVVPDPHTDALLEELQHLSHQ